MEIRDPIHGTMNFTNNEVALVDSPEFQRLRAIKQLGFAEFSFPGATHNRYIHSLGVGHLAGRAFDSVFRIYPFSLPSVKTKYRQVLRLAALLHDVGHGPLSHTTEQAMPKLDLLKVTAYSESNRNSIRRATHEDYTIKYVTDSNLSKLIENRFTDFLPIHVACLIDRSLKCPDDFFVDRDTDFRPILSQLVSSELDADRLDYLERDSYFCGTNYGRIDLEWLLQNITFYRNNNSVYLALNRRALYTFDDFLISRHHMHLMVYCHHKSIVYEELLNRYLSAPNCEFKLPAEIEEYTQYNDYKLHESMAKEQHQNAWAKRIVQRTPYRVLIELHNTTDSQRIEKIKEALDQEKIDTIVTSSKARLSKYHSSDAEDTGLPIYVVDQYDRRDKPTPITRTTEIFKRYEGERIIDRIYVSPENYDRAEILILKSKTLY